MSTQLSATVRKLPADASIIDIRGDITGQAEEILMTAYGQASQGGTKTIILNFEALDYMNSSGIGLLVTMLIRVLKLSGIDSAAISAIRCMARSWKVVPSISTTLSTISK